MVKLYGYFYNIEIFGIQQVQLRKKNHWKRTKFTGRFTNARKNALQEEISTYSSERCSFSKLTPKRHLALVFMSCSFIKGMTVVEWWTIQMQGDTRVSVTGVFHTMKADFI